MTFLIIYVEIRLFLLRLRYFKGLVQLAAFIAAYVTAISRIPDYHHHGTDVIGGSLLGIAVALFITLAVGRVLWVYNREDDYYDFDLKYADSYLDTNTQTSSVIS
jgi:membrane-associated phospholipid phosphatase